MSKAVHLSRTDLTRTLLHIAGLWMLADFGYYLLLPLLGVQPSYNHGGVAITLYYVFWIGIAVIAFWPLYSLWPRYGRATTFANPLASYLVWSISFVACLLFAAYVLPRLPSINWKESWTPPDLVLATPWYFLPKSVEILFQQLLIVALVIALAAQKLSLQRISLYSAAAFGAAHVVLVFAAVPWGYVFRFMISAALFGLLFPYFILRMRNGLAISYLLHWGYYAVSVVLPHIFMASAR
jgi:hypothetical protein